MDHYVYEGPVLNPNNIVIEKWKGETYAISDKKAICNLCYQFKKQHGLLKTAKVTLQHKPIRD